MLRVVGAYFLVPWIHEINETLWIRRKELDVPGHDDLGTIFPGDFITLGTSNNVERAQLELLMDEVPGIGMLPDVRRVRSITKLGVLHCDLQLSCLGPGSRQITTHDRVPSLRAARTARSCKPGVARQRSPVYFCLDGFIGTFNLYLIV